MKKQFAVTTTAVSLGVATLLTMSAVAPASAKSHSTSGSSFSSASLKAASTDTATPAATPTAPKFATVNFTVTGVPAAYTDAATAAKHLVFKVVPLAADATSAPATPPVPAFGKGAPADSTAGAPAAGDAAGKGCGGKGHGPKGQGGDAAWAPAAGSTAAPAPSTSAAPTTGTPAAGAPNFADGAGHKGKGGKGHGPQITNLVLTNGTLTGTISVPAGRTAGVQKFAVYPTVVADSANNVAAKTGTPVLLTVTTAADGSATVAASAAISVSFN